MFAEMQNYQVEPVAMEAAEQFASLLGGITLTHQFGFAACGVKL